MSVAVTSTSNLTNADTLSLLRKVDLNLIVVFEAVMAERNVTRAAKILNMSQPAVSNALSRLRVLFDDELFERVGRGIMPTARAQRLQSALGHAMHIIKDELPNSAFDPATSCKNYNIVFRAPMDQRYVTALIKHVQQLAPKVSLSLSSEVSPIYDSLNKNIDFVIDVEPINNQGFTSCMLASDELVIVMAQDHARLASLTNVSFEALQNEKMAITANLQQRLLAMNVAVNIWNREQKPTFISHSIDEVLSVVSKTDVITIAPRKIIEQATSEFAIQTLSLPSTDNRLTTYLNWHQANDKEGSHCWMQQQINRVFDQTVPYVIA
ncbi:hypothetical protein A9264_04470 [Vibrio sp. UCD-FRSSP16_10]|uniref:transcriptional regulator LeuO n=1 Tax=unclassified Vibrio TaxID=2614977 RepID=UPI000800B1E7|nr:MULTISPECIES: transcriptional regulator LeuO [unclassified Vibrio]OBT08493.1 hypothetical protein A9260_06710 [Vibrio sp. UCD-FRSSP16_30]OBT18023.1 hypothetical protein A9264_04470 [Vibrio sp. UCD-FRSSP16_10]